MRNHRTLFGLLFILISFCIDAQELIQKLPADINTPDLDETSPVISRDGQKLFFTRTADPNFESSLPDSSGQWATSEKDEAFHKELSKIYSQISGQTITDPVASSLNQDIWFAPIIDDTVRSAQHPGYPINNALPNSLVSTGILPNEYILINEFYKDGSMYAGFSRVRIHEDEHTFPEPMYIYGFNIIQSSVNLTMTHNGHALILSINGPGSIGESDLYVSFFVRENVWSTPIHMGKVLNTPYQETTPYITPDKRYLYFSSNRPGGVGGNDIYRAERLDYTWLRWGEPKLVEGEVNSTADDSQPYFDPEARFMYFTSKRDGSSDIFRQQLFERQRLIKPIVVLGKVINRKTGQLTRAEIFWGPLSAQGYLEYFSTYDGKFMVTLSEFEPYKFQLRKSNHTASRILVDPRLIEKQGLDTVEIIFYLDPKDPLQENNLATKEFVQSVLQGDSISMQNQQAGHLDSIKSGKAGQMDDLENESSFYDIYFLQGKAIILSKSENALNQILSELQQNSSLEILIIGHTDNVGDGDALIQLSNERAEAVKRFLIGKGIDTARIRTLGMGAENPMYDNATESGREKNRRVEIKVIKQ